jgi:hypothetical protein
MKSYTIFFRKQGSIPTLGKPSSEIEKEYMSITLPDLSHAGDPQHSIKFDNISKSIS